MNEELEVLKDVTGRLEKARLEYMLSGSMAANYYTVPRMTRDIDIVILLSAADTQRFVEIFENDFYVDKEIVNTEIRKLGMFNLIHKEYIIKIDFILSKHSDFQKMSFARRKKILIEKTPIWLISLEDLILAKLLWAKDSLSEMQLKDVHNLIQTNPGSDQEYLNEWISQLGLEEVYQKAKI